MPLDTLVKYTVLLDVEEENPENNPTAYHIKQNYPNPFNPSTKIEFFIPKTEFVNLKIFDLLGQEVAVIVSQKLNAGKHTFTWDANQFSSGIYYYKLESGNFMQTRKMIYLK
jgi:hypothetical protein